MGEEENDTEDNETNETEEPEEPTGPWKIFNKIKSQFNQ